MMWELETCGVLSVGSNCYSVIHSIVLAKLGATLTVKWKL